MYPPRTLKCPRPFWIYPIMCTHWHFGSRSWSYGGETS